MKLLQKLPDISADCLRIGLHSTCSLPNKLGSMVDMLLLTETWLFEPDIDAIQIEFPTNFTLIHVPRLGTLTCGGGLAIVHKRALYGIKLISI